MFVVANRAFAQLIVGEPCVLQTIANATFFLRNPLNDAMSQLEQLRVPQGETVGKKINRQGLDKYDLAILSALSLNTRLTTVDLAQRVHLSRTAVSRRIAALKRMKVLNDSADVLNYESIGFKVRAKVEISVNGHMSSVMKPKLLQRPEVLSVAVMAGDGLLSADVIAFDMDHLHSFISSIQDDGNTTTKVIFAEEKSQLTLIERMRRLSEEPAPSSP